MKKVQYTTKGGLLQWRPVFNSDYEAAMTGDDYLGFCVGCGSEMSGVEPDMRRGTCDECKQPKVYGLEELLLMGLAR